jgi:hypothetical protein
MADETFEAQHRALQKISVRRQIDRGYLVFVRKQRCAVCRRDHPDAHHLKTRASGGSDYTAVPLCRVHHSEWHQIGGRRFEDRHGVNLWRISHGLVVEFLTGVAA